MKVLIACEFSGIVREAFKKKGHDAWSCDLLPTEIEGQHIQGDVLEILNDGWDLMIAHPPCTYLSRTSLQWLRREPLRIPATMDAIHFFKTLLEAPIEKIAVENPLPSSHTLKYIRKYDQTIQPYNFGDPATKLTCLWLKNLPPLLNTLTIQPEYVISGTGRKWGKWFWETSKLPHSERGQARSRTFQGIADAMAEQWGIQG